MFAIERMNELGKLGIPFLFIIDFDVKNIHVIPLDDVGQSGVFYDIQGVTNYDYSKFLEMPLKIVWQKSPMSFEDYKKGFEIVQKGLRLGDSFLTNLTCATPIKTNLDFEQIFHFSQAKYKLWMKDKFICFSPEIFIKINEQNVIASFPMKGTIDANIPNAKELILNDLKEKAEHNTIVDLIRNDLSKVAKEVNVTRFRYIDLLKTNEKNILQVSSEIQGKLPNNWKENIGNILIKLLPAGSISGAPKNKTIEIIKNAECYNREYYTGVFGFFDGKSLNSGVMIRFIEQINNDFIFKSGGGITVFSNEQSEYQEVINKVYVPISRNHKD